LVWRSGGRVGVEAGGRGAVLVLDVPVHAADGAELLAAYAAHGLPRVILLVVVPGA
jgi:hypothetical protein